MTVIILNVQTSYCDFLFFFFKEMEKSDANNFLILFRDSGCQFRSLYTYCPDTEEINKLTGIGPKSITKKMIEGLYKYNSDRKQFSHIPAKTLSASVDAITIHSHLWQTKRPVTPKKLLPTKAQQMGEISLQTIMINLHFIFTAYRKQISSCQQDSQNL